MGHWKMNKVRTGHRPPPLPPGSRPHFKSSGLQRLSETTAPWLKFGQRNQSPSQSTRHIQQAQASAEGPQGTAAFMPRGDAKTHPHPAQALGQATRVCDIFHPFINLCKTRLSGVPNG